MRTRSRWLLSCTVGVVGALVATVAPVGVAAAPAPVSPVIAAAVDWLTTQQQDDGGFEVAGFPGFETAEVVLALAAAGQSDVEWDTDDALAAVEAVTTPGDLDALDALDAFIDGLLADTEASAEARAQQAAKLVVLVAVPLGLDPTDFDPAGDSAGPVDLVDALVAASGPDDDYAGMSFTGRAYAAWALAAVGQPVPAALVDALVAAQTAAGGWNFMGDPGDSVFDPDTTATVVMALSAAHRPKTDPVIGRALGALALNQERTGEWASPFDDGNPNSTALAMLAVATLGHGPDRSCWRHLADPHWADVRYPAPGPTLEAGQAPDGHIASPNDGWGVNTLATSQAVQALAAAEQRWPYQPAPGERETACEALTGPGVLSNNYYVDLLGRPADGPGHEYWVGQLAQGVTPAQVARRLVGSSEYRVRVVSALYAAYLGAPPSADELQAGTARILAGGRFSLVADILGSETYYEQAGGTPGDWLAAAFFDLFGRTPAEDPWVAQVIGPDLEDSGARRRLVRQLLHTIEGLGAWVDTVYRDLLGRPADPAGVAYWSAQIRRGVSPERVITLIVGSGEYAGRFLDPPV